MKITVLTPHLGNPWPNLGDLYIAMGIGRLLDGHELCWLPLHMRPTPAILKQAQESDLLVIGGSNILGVMGTVRIGWRGEDFEALNCPILPLALGAQAPVNGAVRIDSAGRRLLDVIARKSQVISARDHWTAAFLAGLYGAQKVRLTGCTAGFAGQVSAVPRGQDTVFCPGPLFGYISMAKNWRYWQSMRHCLKEMAASRVIGHQNDAMYWGRLLGMPVVWQADDTRAMCLALASAGRLVTGRIHAAICTVQHGIPSVVIASDARCVALAQTCRIPYIAWPASARMEEAARVVRCALDSYDQPAINEAMHGLRSSMLQMLQGYGIDGAGALASQVVIPQQPFSSPSAALLTSYAVTCAKHAPGLYPMLRLCHAAVRA